VRSCRLALVFAFGLLHGAGFAQVLSELIVDRSNLLPALVAFNVGVEAGQVVVLALGAAATGVVLRVFAIRPRVLTMSASAAIAVVGAYWTWQRLVGA